MDHIKAVFIEEATELLADLEKSLLVLEQAVDQQAVEQVFRVMHTLKGNSAMFGFDHMGEITHHLESIYDGIRKGKLSASEEIIGVTLSTVDHLRSLLNDPILAEPQTRTRHSQLIAQICSLSAKADQKVGAQPQVTEVEKVADLYDTYYILFRPEPQVLERGANLLFLLDELHQLGPCLVHAHTRQVPELQELKIDQCYIHWDAYLSTNQPEDKIREIFMFVEDECQLEIHSVGEGNLLENKLFVSHVEQHNQEGQEVDIHQLQDYVNQLLQIIRRKTLAEQQLASELQPQTRRESTVLSSIRVASEKVDELMNLVIELVTTQARLSLVAEKSHQPDLLAVAENIEKITRRLRDSTFNISLVPLETLMTRFQRLVRDLSTELGKDIRFVTEGADTELDKTIIESLSDPLMHIIRNSIDHGIEDAFVRANLGKPRQGKILLKAYYSGNNVVIQVQDDGGGLSTEKIREKAISRGLVASDTSLTEKEWFDLIFLPGFSTASQVTEVSGRGVGMDVVKRRITDMRGEVSLASQPNIGTTLTIRLPLTVSIIDGLLVRIEDTHYVIPLAVVDKCYEVKHEQLVGRFNNLLVLDGEQVPFHYLRDEFSVEEPAPDIEQMVVVHYEGKRVGLSVDAIVGEYQAVLKPLGRYYKNHQLMSGATILGDGTVALVMDTNFMIRQISRFESFVSIN
jgi:two-component system chemotaxis sensor kinase CheA